MSEELEIVECPMCSEDIEVPADFDDNVDELTCPDCGHVFGLEDDDEDDDLDLEEDEDEEDDED